MAYKICRKIKENVLKIWLKDRLLKKSVLKRVSFFLAQTPLNSQRKVPKIKRKLNPQNKIRKLTNSSPNALIKSPN